MSKLEIFNDPCYFDMWCLRKKDDKDFTHTIHLSKKEDAENAKKVIELWINTNENE